MRQLQFTRSYRNDIKRMVRRGLDFSRLDSVVNSLAAAAILDAKFRDHPLQGVWKGWRECHISPDWLLIYKADKVHVILGRTGTHSDLFNK